MVMQPPFNKKSSCLAVVSPNGSRRSSQASVTFQIPEEEPKNTLPPKTEMADVTERNTFLEVDPKGHKTLSIFRCYTSPVYRRLFSSASTALGNGESTADLGALEENIPGMPPGLYTKKSTGLSSLDAVAEGEEPVRRSTGAVQLQEGAELPKKQRKQRKSKKDKTSNRHYTADLEPFGKFEKYQLEPLNTGNRRSSMEAPAPLDDIPLYPSPRHMMDMHLGVGRRNSKNSDGFHSAVASPSMTITVNEGTDVTPLDLSKRVPSRTNTGDNLSPKAPAKVRVTEEHGGVPEELCTTIMVRNIPNKYSQRMLQEVFVNFGFDGTFDFLYVPADFFHRLNLGYCFVNFKKPAYAQQFAKIFQDYHLPAFKSKKKIQISLANTQGFVPNVMKLEHTALCSQYVSPEFHPICIDPDTNEERPFLSFFPGYTPPPKNRLEDPDYWENHDKTWQKQWTEDTLYPPVYVSQPGGQATSAKQHSQAKQPQAFTAQAGPPGLSADPRNRPMTGQSAKGNGKGHGGQHGGHAGYGGKHRQTMPARSHWH